MVMHRTRLLLTALGAFALGACSGAEPPSGAAGAAGELGARLYEGSCVACHQADGHGIAGVYPSLSGSPVVLGDPAPLTRWVLEGRRPVDLPAGRYGTRMPAFGWLKPPDAAALFTYLRSHFGNAGTPVDSTAVARALGDS